MTADGDDAERVVVKTYVPRYQKEAWRDHAEAMGMSQSEFLRTMVQAGRRGFDPDVEKPDSAGSDPGGDGLENDILAALSEQPYQSWDELLAWLSDNLEERLDDAMTDLQASNRVQYSGRHGGYALTDSTHE